MSNSFENFERAFRGGVSGCRRTCACGITYWDTWNSGYDWEEGEIEELQKDPKARGLDHSVGTIEFEGEIYVDGCTCWHERAKKIQSFVDSHAVAIAEYLSLEKKRKQQEADLSPVVQ